MLPPTRPLLWLLVTIVLVPTITQAQPISSAYSFGGTSADTPAAIAVDAEGSRYVAGTFEGTIDFGGGVSITSAGDSDAFLVKFDADGTALWARRAGTDVFNDFGEDVAVAIRPDLPDAGRVSLTGTFTGEATFDGGSAPDTTITTLNDFDAFVATYNTAGDLEWVRRIGGTEQDVARAVAVQPGVAGAPDIVVAGGFTGEAQVGDTTLVSIGGGDNAYVARFTSEGELVWARSAGGSDGATAYDVALSANGETLMTGQFDGVASFDDDTALQSVGRTDIFVAKYDGGGAVTWAQRLGGADDDYVRGLVLSKQGLSSEATIYVAGAFSGEVLIASDVLTSAGFTDGLAVALDHDGTPLWGRRSGGDGFDWLEDITTPPPPHSALMLPEGQLPAPLYITGYIDESATVEGPDSTITLSSAGGQDGFLAAYETGIPGDEGDESGRLLDAFSFGGTDRDQGSGLAIVPQASANDLDPVITGSFRGSASFGEVTLTSTGSLDGFLTQVESCPDYFCPTNAEDTPSTLGLRLSPASPNPVRGAAALTLTLSAPRRHVEVALFDALGRHVALLHDGPMPAGETPLTLNASDLPAGLYLVRATGIRGAVSRSVTVVR